MWVFHLDYIHTLAIDENFALMTENNSLGVKMHVVLHDSFMIVMSFHR